MFAAAKDGHSIFSPRLKGKQRKSTGSMSKDISNDRQQTMRTSFAAPCALVGFG